MSSSSAGFAPSPWIGCLLAASVGLFGCALDDRVLRARGESHGGASGAGEGRGGDAWNSAGAPSAEGPVDGCADLDTDGVADCTTTLVRTPSFASDVSGWAAVGDATLAWSPKNAFTDLPSGAAELSSASSLGRAQQCLSLGGARLLIAYANALVEQPDDESELGRALLEVSFFDRRDCAGERASYFETPASSSGAWATVHAGGSAAETTRSVSVALVVVKPAASQLSAYFDNVMVKAQAP